MKCCKKLGCNNDGIIPVQVSRNEWGPMQCEFCYTEPDSVFNHIAKRDHVIECAITMVERMENTMFDQEKWRHARLDLIESLKPFMPDTMTHKQTGDRG